ncbi:Hypothetical protein R9X50_00441300 [Acrodontium crateriforme]|uniref:Histidinol-phosphatase n=1 Tax=Acrodontium crateriforme TaxID=150365 RepID=A0AAQ3R519_9PEZI|nr:Hypothetical protein R9X50_00441300 [Acrodontium crateriforme]
MPFSHHSHSGQFCGHAVNTLEEVVQDAIAKGMTTFCMTEHMPREEHDFYPEEANAHTTQTMAKMYDDFYHEARRLQKAYAHRIQLFVGFEADWIRNSSVSFIQNLLAKYPVDLFVGSVHHVHTVPIDYDIPLYHKSRDISGGADERIYEDYFDDQYQMLQSLKPPLVGHFDLIRLKSDDPERSLRAWPSVWEKVLRNLKYIAEYGGVVELNSSSLRKGMTEAYPQVDICKEFLRLGGQFTLSDDSHGIAQVGLNYDKVLRCMDKAGITELSYLVPTASEDNVHDQRFPTVQWKTISKEDLQAHGFWRAMK